MSKKRKNREPLRYDPPFEQEEPEQPEVERPKYKTKLAYLLDPEEVTRLIAASQTPLEEPKPPADRVEYTTYTQEDVIALINGEQPRKKRKKPRS